MLDASSVLGGRLSDANVGAVTGGQGSQTVYGDVNNPIALICHQVRAGATMCNANNFVTSTSTNSELKNDTR